MNALEQKSFLIHLHGSVFGRGEQERDLVMKGLIPKDFRSKFYPLYQKHVLNEEVS